MSTSGSTRRPVLRFFWASTRKSHGAASARFLTKASRLGSRPVAQCQPPAVLQQAERAGTHIVQRAGVFVPGQRVGRILTLRPGGKIGRIARTHVKTALPLPEGAQVGAMGRDVADVLFGDSIGQQGAALGLELQRRTGAAVAAVVPLQRHDAAAGAQVGRRLAAFCKSGPAAARPTRTGGQGCSRPLFYYTKLR